MKQRQRRSRIGTTGLDRAIAFCFQYLNGDRYNGDNLFFFMRIFAFYARPRNS